MLLAGERVALENRLDLMNARAQLYDAWRQIRVTANGLQGIFNVAVTNQFLTPPNTTNPFAFVDQAKQFQLVLNAELPLVRVAERNNFRTALIDYQRQRRALQGTEDDLKLQIRQEIRNVQQQYLTYEIAKRNFVLQVRQKDQSFEQIVAPPGRAAGAVDPGGDPDAEPDHGPERHPEAGEQPGPDLGELPARAADPLPRPRHLTVRRMGGLP